MNPSGGVGAINAIHDAVTLANWMSTLRNSDDKVILKVFKEYRAERYPVAKAAFKDSQMLTRTIGKNLLSTIFRGMIKRIPFWVWKRIVYKMNAARYQASFLPLIEDNAPCKALYQHSLYKTMAIHEELAKTSIEMTAGNSAPAVV
ncbi:hypothetical protein MVEG_03446 [Podila verticillata NRRL 6337]|nr:hypothetical protein MVEG_03446 [Podila verticillata NRRL 6337]